MKKTFFLLVLTLFSTFIYSQTEKKSKFNRPMYQGKISNEDFFKEADYIFEGTRIESYKNIDSNCYYVIHKIYVNEVFKGNLDTGIIYIIRPLSDNDSYNFHDKSIYFCIKNNINIKCVKISFNNSQLLSFYENRLFGGLFYNDDKNYDFEIYGLNHLYFKTKNDFYQYLTQFKGCKKIKPKPIPNKT